MISEKEKFFGKMQILEERGVIEWRKREEF